MPPHLLTMKTNEKIAPVSKALSEVWEWKDAVYKDINLLPKYSINTCLHALLATEDIA